MRRIARVGAGALAFIFWMLCGPLAYADFTLIPVSVLLTPQKPTNLLTIHNNANNTVRMQLSVYSWAQAPDGTSKLTPTDDVVFYPPILSVDPNADSIVRVGAAVPFALVEKSYRMMAEEMPPPPAPQSAAETGRKPKVLVLTKLSIPVFFQAARVVHSDTISDAVVRGGVLSFKVRNDGNTHLNIIAGNIAAMDAGGKVVFQHGVGRVGYVLPNEYREYQMIIPTCPQTRKLTISVPVSRMMSEYDSKLAALKAELDVTPDMCAAGGAASAR